MTPEQYANKEARQPSRNWQNLCLQFVRSCFGVPARYPSAASAWEHATAKHHTTDAGSIPALVPVWWGGGSHGYGHVALSTGHGLCFSTDIKQRGHVDHVPIALIHARWGLPLLGWSEDINGVTVYHESETTDMNEQELKRMEIARWSPDSDKRGTMPFGKQINQARGYSADTYHRVVAVEKQIAEIQETLETLVQEIKGDR